MCLRRLLAAAALLSGALGYQRLPWHQYYKTSSQRWEPTSSGRSSRVRCGQGRYRMVPGGAELTCQFPSSTVILSNIIWERADMGALKSLDELYKRAGEEHEYRVITWQNGSRLQLKEPSSLTRGLYRCIATGLDPANPRPVTLFQDVSFYPTDLGSQWRSNHFNRPCCRELSYDDFRRHSYLMESSLYYH